MLDAHSYIMSVSSVQEDSANSGNCKMPWKAVVGEDPTRPASAAAARSSALKLGSKVEIAQAHENELDGRLPQSGTLDETEN